MEMMASSKRTESKVPLKPWMHWSRGERKLRVPYLQEMVRKRWREGGEGPGVVDGLGRVRVGECEERLGGTQLAEAVQTNNIRRLQSLEERC
jgi:hypothetical protein